MEVVILIKGKNMSSSLKHAHTLVNCYADLVTFYNLKIRALARTDVLLFDGSFKLSCYLVT